MAMVAAASLYHFGQHWLVYLSSFLTICLALFFRRAPAPAQADARSVLSPAGGFVIEIVQEEEPVFLKAPG